jgi:branched-chain amino acid transport system permease protein
MKNLNSDESRFSKYSKIIGKENEYLVIWFLLLLLLIYFIIIVFTQDNPFQLVLGHTADGTTIAISALGFSLIFGVAKQLKLSVGGYYVLGAYIMFFLVESLNMSITASFDGFLTLILFLIPISLVISFLFFFAYKLRNYALLLLIILSTIIAGLGSFFLTGNLVQGSYSALVVILLTVSAWYFELRPIQIAISSLILGIAIPLLMLIGIPTDYLSLAILAFLFTAVIAMLEDRLLLDKVRHSPVNVLIITFAVALLIQSIVQLFYYPKNGSFDKFGPDQRFLAGIVPKTDISNIFGATIRTLDLIVLGFSILAIILLYLFIWYTRMGRAIRAVAQDEDAAGIVGINIRKVTAIVSGLGFGLVGFAGVLISPVKAVPFWSPFMGWFILIQVIVVVTLGGLGSLSGTIIASFVYAYAIGLIGIFLPELLVVFPFVVVLVVILIKPEGLLGRKKELETAESPY